jgi:hypothetical protein
VLLIVSHRNAVVLHWPYLFDPLFSPLPPFLSSQARKAGLWNLWLPASLASRLGPLVALCPEGERAALLGPGLNNLEYAHLCEITGR